MSSCRRSATRAVTALAVLGAGLALAMTVFATQRKLLQARWPGDSAVPEAQS